MVDRSDSYAAKVAMASHWPDMKSTNLATPAAKKVVCSTACMQAISEAKIIELCTMSLVLAPMARSSVFLFSCFSEGRGSSPCCDFPSFSEVRNFDCMVHNLIL